MLNTYEERQDAFLRMCTTVTRFMYTQKYTDFCVMNFRNATCDTRGMKPFDKRIYKIFRSLKKKVALKVLNDE